MEKQTAVKRQGGALGSRPDRAAPVGTTIKTRIERGAKALAAAPCDLHITVLEVIRGEQAWGRVQREGLVGLPARTGMEYLLARIRFAYSCAARGRSEHAPYVLEKGQLAAAAGDGRTEFETPDFPQQPQPQILDVPFAEGDAKEGWILVQVPQDEKEPLLVFHREHDNKYSIQGPLWLRLYHFDPMCIEDTCGECVVRAQGEG